MNSIVVCIEYCWLIVVIGHYGVVIVRHVLNRIEGHLERVALIIWIAKRLFHNWVKWVINI